MTREEERNRLRDVLTNDPFLHADRNDAEYIGAIVGGDQPSRYSQSPWLWNRFFSETGIRGLFTSFDLSADGSFSTFASVAGDINGLIDLTVTNPYKAIAYRHLEDFGLEVSVTNRSLHLECLNHIIVRPGTGRAVVDLTDGFGMIRALAKRRPLSGQRVLLAGAGGAGRAIGYELVQVGAGVTICDIVDEEAVRLTELLRAHRTAGGDVKAIRWAQRAPVAAESDVVVSAISATSPLTHQEIASLKAECLCADTRYGARAAFAELVRLAQRDCIDGREMLFGQFAPAAFAVAEILGLPDETAHPALDRVEKWFMRL